MTNLQDLSLIHDSRMSQPEAKQETGTLGMSGELGLSRDYLVSFIVSFNVYNRTIRTFGMYNQ